LKRRYWVSPSVRIRLLGHNETGEVVEDCLPACALLLGGVGRLDAERNPELRAPVGCGECDFYCAIPEGLFDQPGRYDFGADTGEIEPEAAILGFHP